VLTRPDRVSKIEVPRPKLVRQVLRTQAAQHCSQGMSRPLARWLPATRGTYVLAESATSLAGVGQNAPRDSFRRSGFGLTRTSEREA